MNEFLVNALVAPPTPTPKTRVEQAVEGIANTRRQISQMEQEIVSLRRQLIGRHLSGVNGRPIVKVDAIHTEIATLEDTISNLQSRVETMQHNLPLLIASENAAAEIERQTAEKERQKAAADRAAHDAAVRASALAQWLQVPGQNQAGFEVAWPAIAGQIALNRAVEAGAAESQADHLAPMRQVARDALDRLYGKKVSA